MQQLLGLLREQKTQFCGLFLGKFGRATFVAEEPLCDLGIPFPVRRIGTQLRGAPQKCSKPSFVETYNGIALTWLPLAQSELDADLMAPVGRKFYDVVGRQISSRPSKLVAGVVGFRLSHYLPPTHKTSPRNPSECNGYHIVRRLGV